MSQHRKSGALRALPILLMITVGACYRYVPATRSDVTPPLEVRARLSEEGMQDLGGRFSRAPERIDGRLVRWDDDGIALEITTEVRREGFPPTTLREVLELAPEHVAFIERQQVDAWQTGGVVAAILAGTVAAVLATRTVGGEQGDPEPPPEEPQAAIGLRFP